MAIPLLRSIFLEADDLVQAMQARGYTTDRRTEPQFAMYRKDWLVVVGLVFLLVTLAVLG